MQIAQTVEAPANTDAITAAVEQMPCSSAYIARIGIIPTKSLKYFVIIRCIHTTTHKVCMDNHLYTYKIANELLLHKSVDKGHLHAICEHR